MKEILVCRSHISLNWQLKKICCVWDYMQSVDLVDFPDIIFIGSVFADYYNHYWFVYSFDSWSRFSRFPVFFHLLLLIRHHVEHDCEIKFITSPLRVQSVSGCVDAEQFVGVGDGVQIRSLAVEKVRVRLPDLVQHFDARTKFRRVFLRHKRQSLVLPHLTEVAVHWEHLQHTQKSSTIGLRFFSNLKWHAKTR